jgi:hypothetical protein
MALTRDCRDDNAITIGWRFRQLLATGLDLEQALQLAEEPAVDVHRIVELVENGCPLHLAVRIVAPLTPNGSVQRECSLSSV